ncbi:hypothetical protein ASG63_16390 [Methylobacterium sp. Leaf94]|uniref:hypothetical protein n=1 Tax=Methylobacterium sp. Leaf94 TaxID=1736250 RepID=UPI0006FB35D4|nr:hypothetical protein [Methylobacterium sp. Leaf94]KQU31077.1 hypothetical protein ASG63_16390 [Methylobacterium sp. Leaf94]
MSKAPEFVVTGVHVPQVDFWARVLINPERLQQVKHSILTLGQVYLQPGEVLEVDTRSKEDIERAMTVMHPRAGRLVGACLVAWNEIKSDVTVYGSNSDRIASVADCVVSALSGRTGPFKWDRKNQAILLHSDHLDSIRVGSVHVHFDRAEDPEVEPDDDSVDPDDEAYCASMARQSELKAALQAERLNGLKLRRFKPAQRSA